MLFDKYQIPLYVIVKQLEKNPSVNFVATSPVRGGLGSVSLPPLKGEGNRRGGGGVLNSLFSCCLSISNK
jgi:hypothetical protein